MQVQRQIEELLALRASEWFELLPTASPEQLRALEAWLGESKLHVQEFLEIAEVEFCLQGLDSQRQQDVEALLKRIRPVVAALPERAAAGPFSLQGRRKKIVALAAACATLVIAGAILLAQLNASNEFATAIGEQRIVELSDSSVVTLNADSEIEVQLQDSERRIELLRGEAIFKVVHDPTRPFRVHTRAGVIQAVGTQFNVRNRMDGSTRVSVLEGRVRLTAQPGDELLLEANEEADIALDGRIQRHDKAVVANSVAWRQRRLVFENAPLEEMVAEFNRHNRSVRLRLEGIEGDARRYDGVFEATDPGALAQLLSREPDLVVERRVEQIVIRRR